MKNRRLAIFMFVAGVVLAGLLTVGPPTALADSIGGPGSSCGSCFGTIYTLTYDPVPDSTTPTTQTFDIILTLDTGATTGVGPNLAAVAVKVASSAMGVLEGSPSVGWTEMDGGLSANGCDGSGSGFVCAQNLGMPVTVPDGTYQWVWDVTVPTGTLFTGTMEASVKALYQDASFKQNGITSEDITLQKGGVVPEPAAVTLTCVVLLAFGALVVRARRELA